MKRTLLVAALAALAAAPLDAQRVYWQPRSAGYGALGFGGGNFTLDCDSVCGNNELSAAGITLMLGRHVSSRVRIELGTQFQNNRDSSSNVFTGQLGAAAYLVGGLYLRGGVSYSRLSVEQAAGTFEGSGGPGWMVGAGYDLHLGRTFALTPFVNYGVTSLSTIDITGGGTGTTGGTVTMLTFGAALTSIRGHYVCVTAAGERVRVVRSNRDAALACLNQITTGRPAGIKL